MSTLRGSLGGPLAKRAAAGFSLFASLGIMASALVPSVITASASGIPDVGGAGVFELDGNVAQNTATPPPYDWSCVFNVPAGHAGCPPTATPADTNTTPTFLGSVFTADFATPDPTYFTSNKDILDVTTWGCTTLNNPTPKDDILNAYGAVFLAQGNAANGKAGHELLYLGQDRSSNNGDSFAGFWLMHKQHSCSGSGSFSGGGHTVGDLLVVSNYTNGGTNPTIELFAWDPTAPNNLKMLASGFTCGATSPPPGLVNPDDICGIAAVAPGYTEPWAPNASIGANQSVEIGIDLTDLLNQGIFPPSTDPNAGCFNDFLAETRSSQETTATLKDFASGRFTFCVSPKVTTEQTSGSTTSPGLTVERGATVSDQATLGAPIAGTPKGTVTYSLYSTSDCSGTAVFTNTQTLSGGTIPPSTGFDTSSLTPGTTYQWQASYSGDIALGGHNFPAQSTCGDEPLNVVDAYIKITPHTATNEVGNQHVFDVTAAVLPASATLSNATITTNVSPAPGTSATTCGSPTISGNQATCTITINNSAVNTFTANAAATLVTSGVTMHRSTDSSVIGSGPPGPGGSGPATKNYVDAFITITPNTADNEVGNAHVFHITLTALPGNALPVSFGAISASVSPTTGLTTNTSTCGSPNVNGNVETCTLTINSNTAGTYVANATGAVTIGGVLLSRTTAPDGSAAGPGGSGPATKHYVDAFITISPNGINPVGQEHVFNILVQAIPGGASPVSFGAITTNITPAPGFQSTTCGSPTSGSTALGPTESCTLTVDNSLANVFSATASVHVTMGTVTVARSTDGTGQNSPPATKTYVDAAVSIGPSADNEVGNAHVFTVTVKAIPSGATPVVFKSIVPSITPTAGLTQNTSTCATPVVTGPDGSGDFTATCTVTINSNTAGTYTANVTATVDMGTPAAEVVRSTDSAVAPHGPGGSGPATKHYVDANIQLSPLTATNNVNSPHTVTVTVNAFPGGTGTPSFSNIVPVVSPAPSSGPTTTCGSPTISNGGNTAICTVTFNSNVPAVFTINASADVTMGTVTVQRATNGNMGPGGTGPATKIYGQPSISIAPNGVNEVGHAHTFTITVNSVPGTTTVFNSIGVLVVPTPDSLDASSCANPTLSNGGLTATCTATINSATAGVFTATATATLTVNGFQTTISTDGTAPNSGAAVKRYVDASVAIAPSAVNEVNHEHVFTITATAIPSGAGTPTFAITPSVSPTPDLTNSSTCGSPVVSGPDGSGNFTAVCTVTIDSSVNGTFTANAAVTVSVGGVTMNRTTAPDGSAAGPGGSGPAVKQYVDAAVGIGPSAVNPIGQEHVFDIVVTALPGSATPVVFGTITPSVSPQPMTSTNTCDNPTINGNQATCTLTIDNNLPDTFQANVTAQVTMGGVTVTRSTATNPGPGGTGPATKTYVTANIGISPLNATDPVGDLHTLTVTVTTNNGSGEGQPAAAPDGTVVSLDIVSGPGSLASPSCTISNGQGTCTDVLTSDVAGTTVINASVTLVVDGVTLHRSTNDSVPGDSPNAVKNWHKVQPSITTTQSPNTSQGGSVSDTATVSGGLNPTGTVTFQLFGPGDLTCTTTPVFIASDQPLSGGTAQSGSFTPAAAGQYEWVATYNGDNANLTAVSGCGDEPVVITQTLAIHIPNTGAELTTALAEGLGLVLAGTGIVVVAKRRRRSKGN